MSIDSNRETVLIWQKFLSTHTWTDLIDGREPQFSLGPIVYTLPNPLGRSQESFAIVDMRTLKKEQISPHYHKHETEIHFVLEGSGIVVVGGKEIQLEKGVTVIIPPDTAHYDIPHSLVLAVVNTPAFNAENIVSLAELRESNEQVGFNYQQFKQLVSQAQL